MIRVSVCTHMSVCVYALTVHPHSGAVLSGYQAGPFAWRRQWDLPLSGLPRSVAKSEAKPEKVSRSPYSLLLPQGCCFIFLVPVQYVIYSVFVKNCNWLITVRKRVKNRQGFTWVVNQTNVLMGAPASVRRLTCRCWSRGAISQSVSSTLSSVMLFVPTGLVFLSRALAKLRSVDVLCTGTKRY